MGRHAEWEVVNKKDNIVLIRDLDRSGCLSVTNDAEYVYATVNRFNATRSYRVVYEDSVGEWTELVATPSQWHPGFTISFKPWHGEAWDNLTKAY
jgi:hypothetical protein